MRLVEHQLLDEGKTRLQEGLELAREYELNAHLNFAKSSLAQAAWYGGDLEGAEALLVELLEIARCSGSELLVVAGLRDLGAVSTRLGKFAKAERYLKGALDLIVRSEGVLMANLGVLWFLGELRIAEGALAAGAVWLSFVLEHAASGSKAGAESERLLEDLRGRVPPGELTAAVEHGSTMTLDDITLELRPTM